MTTQKQLIDKRKNWENVPILKVVDVVFGQSNLADDYYQQISEVLNIYTPAQSYAYLLHV